MRTRGRIPTALISRASALADAEGARFASVGTQLWNAPAHASYAKLGFRPHCVLVGRSLDLRPTNWALPSPPVIEVDPHLLRTLRTCCSTLLAGIHHFRRRGEYATMHEKYLNPLGGHVCHDPPTPADRS